MFATHTQSSVLGSNDGLGEGYEVAAGVLDGKFFHAVERGADGHDEFCIFHGSEDGVEIVNL
jgi:hypothetical protein